MRNFRKIAALGLLLCAVSASLIGCRNENQLSERLETIKLGATNAVSLDSGEIMVYETLKTEYDVSGKLESSVTETYVKFDHADGLRYDFTENKKIISTGAINKLEALQENGKLTVMRDNAKVAESEAPDIFAYFKVDYEVADVEAIEVIESANGKMVYTVTMTDAFADRFDSEADGIKITCDKVLYNYFINAAGVTESQLSECTMSAEFDGKKQTVTHFVQTSMN